MICQICKREIIDFRWRLTNYCSKDCWLKAHEIKKKDWWEKEKRYLGIKD